MTRVRSFFPLGVLQQILKERATVHLENDMCILYGRAVSNVSFHPMPPRRIFRAGLEPIEIDENEKKKAFLTPLDIAYFGWTCTLSKPNSRIYIGTPIQTV